MASHAVFLRAANVGGNNEFRPKAFCEAHPELLLSNFGAAGTFVSRAALGPAALKDALCTALPVAVDMAIVPLEDVKRVVTQGPWPCPDGAKQEVTVLLGDRPAAKALDWHDGDIDLAADLGWAVVTNRHPGGRLTPYQLVERATGVPGTTRSWGMMEKVAKA